jgi:hypothetical protein
MYVNNIDDLIDSTLEKFDKYVHDTILINELTKEKNFVKYNNKINNIVHDFIKTLNNKQIQTIVNKLEYVDYIYEVIKRYCIYYIYLLIAYHYTNDRDLFMTNLMETGKYQKDSVMKVQNFFNSENYGLMSKFFHLIKSIQVIVKFKSFDKIKTFLNNNHLKYDHVISLFQSLGEDFIIKYFFIEDNEHNIIKTIIINQIYMKNDANNILQTISHVDDDNAEYKYIDIVVSTKDNMIDYRTLESLFTPQQLRSGTVEKIYDFLLMNKETFELTDLTVSDKINYLFEKKIIIPISEDFLRYHKDSDKHDIQIENEGTKIKQIISKINNAKNLYSITSEKKQKLLEEIQTSFYVPLNHRRTLLYNDYDEIRIIKKIKISMGLSENTDLSDNYYELENIRKYNYLNFKDLSRYGIKIRPHTPIEAIRYTNIQYPRQNKQIDVRVGTNILDLNVVGVILNPSYKSTQCYSGVDLRNVNDISGNNNGYKSMMDILYKYSNKNGNKLYYWLFNSKNDRPSSDTFINISDNNTSKNIETSLNNFYDEWLVFIHKRAIHKIKDTKYLTFWDIENYLKFLNNKLINFTKHPEIKSQIYNYIINHKLIKVTNTLDEHDEQLIFFGKNTIKLPTYIETKQKRSIIEVYKKHKKEQNVDIAQDIILCYHNIAWINVQKMVKDTNRFSQAIYDFIKQYVKFNDQNEYICKSCYELLPIKKYVFDGSWDEESSSVITNIVASTKSLKDLPQYSKLSRTIKNIERIIEIIGTSTNYISIIGNTPVNKQKRTSFIKDIIDCIVESTKIYKQMGAKRIENISQNYGVHRKLTNLFFFELTDDIFIASSTDTDYYKLLKRNNIIVYIIFILLMDNSIGQLRIFKEDKQCNYFMYSRGGKNLFNNLYIRINSTDKVSLLKFPVLCYTIYYLTCIITKNKLWIYESTDSKINITIQQTIIHTLIDLINSIIEVNLTKKKHSIFEILSFKFLHKLTTVYNNVEILEYIDQSINKKIKINTETNKISYIVKKIQNIPITGQTQDYNESYYLPVRCQGASLQLPKNDIEKQIDFNIFLNCQEEKFNKIKLSNGEHICSVYGKNIKNMLNNKNNNNSHELYNNIKYAYLEKISKKYCIEGGLHNVDSLNVCKKCNLDLINDIYSFKQLDLLEEIINTNKEHDDSLKYNKYHQNLNEKDIYDKKAHNIIEKLKENYLKEPNIIEYCTEFILKLVDIIGPTITINNEKINLNDTMYIINHSYNGTPLKENLTLYSSDKKIKIHKNHPEINKDVIYYLDKKNNAYVYYDIISFKLLAYKIMNKELKYVSHSVYLEINYSIFNMLTIFGLNNFNININDIDKEYVKYITTLNKEDSIYLYNKVIRQRIFNLKQIIIKINSSMQNIKKLPINKQSPTKLQNIIKQFKSKIKHINLTQGNEIFFDDWQIINDNLYMDELDDSKISIINKTINIHNLSNIKNNDTLLLYYLIYNFNKILKFNQNNFNKVNIVNFIIEIIHEIHNIHYIPSNNLDIKKFEYIIQSDKISDNSIIVQGIYNEIVTEEEYLSEENLEKLYDAEQEQEAVDVDDGEESDDFHYEWDHGDD